MPVPPTYTVHRGPSPYCGEDACSDSETNEIWLAESRDRFTFEHELGHLYLERMTGYWKGAVLAHLRVPDGTPWDNGTDHDCDSRACPSELAADAYATCALGWVPGGRAVGHGARRHFVGKWESAYGYEPTRRQHRAVCRTIRRSARESRLDPL